MRRQELRFPFTSGNPEAHRKGLIPWSISQDFSPVLLPPAHSGSFTAADLEEWLGKLTKCRLSQPRLGPEISNFSTQPKWFRCRGSDPGRGHTDFGVVKLEGPQPPSQLSALPALMGLSDLLTPPSPAQEGGRTRRGESDRKCHIARKLNFLP